MSNNVSIKETEEEFIISVKKNVPLIPSKSGKTFLVGSTNGFLAMNNGFSISLNVIKNK